MRLRSALNVDDLDRAVDFHARMVDATPTRRTDYANVAVDQPPLKLVLFEGAEATGSINHPGVETETSVDVVATEQRLRAAGLSTSGIDATECWYAQKTETCVDGPDGHPWEWHVRTGDSGGSSTSWCRLTATMPTSPAAHPTPAGVADGRGSLTSAADLASTTGATQQPHPRRD